MSPLLYQLSYISELLPVTGSGHRPIVRAVSAWQCVSFIASSLTGVAYGIRTREGGVKVRCPGPLGERNVMEPALPIQTEDHPA